MYTCQYSYQVCLYNSGTGYDHVAHFKTNNNYETHINPHHAEVVLSVSMTDIRLASVPNDTATVSQACAKKSLLLTGLRYCLGIWKCISFRSSAPS